MWRAARRAKEARRQRLRTLRDYSRCLERYGALSWEEEDQAALEDEDMAAEILASGADELVQHIGELHREQRPERDRPQPPRIRIATATPWRTDSRTGPRGAVAGVSLDRLPVEQRNRPRQRPVERPDSPEPLISNRLQPPAASPHSPPTPETPPPPTRSPQPGW